MTLIQNLGIAVIGDEDLVNGLRLAGVNKHHILSGDDAIRDEIRGFLKELLSDPGVGVIVILEDYRKYVDDLLAKMREEKRMTPVVVEVPSKYGTRYQDVNGYYRQYIRDFIGFDLQI